MAVAKTGLKSVKPRDLSNSPVAAMFGISSTTREIINLSIDVLDAHSQQEHYSMESAELDALAENIKEVGVLDPVHVRPRPEGRYTILAGHRRTEASRRAGLTEVPCVVDDVDDATATIIFNATNVYSRETLLASERMYGYVEIQKALAAKGATSSRTTASIAELTGDNKRQIQRYMRLQYLIPPLLNAVDEGKVALYAAVSLSYLSSLSQENLLKVMLDKKLSTITMEQADALKQAAKPDVDMKTEEIETVLGCSKESAPKKTPAPVIKIKLSDISDMLPADCADVRDARDYILHTLESVKKEMENHNDG